MLFQRSISSQRSASPPPNPNTTAANSNEKAHIDHKDKGKDPEQSQAPGMTTMDRSHPTTTTTTPPTTPNKRRHSLEIFVTKMRSPRSPNSPTQARKIESISGDSPVSHPGLCDSLTCSQKASIQHRDTFTCAGGVNMVRLLGATRQTLLERAEEAGANCLVDEKWKCTIIAPRRLRGAYKVQILYSAYAAKSSECDPHKPVALESAKGVPGLMTILERQE
ncbi:hypothetical protein V5O48_016286 [Marasmius crinis-equi]|uniref:Uncharacterized protein n=1 Tax=Marasmius crinis-equi TaxID=585013 RepID=A0ABR3ES76_9AGAR